MASVGRSILDRYPVLRSTWPVRKVREWRAQRRRRATPRRMASWYRDTPDMHTRVFVSNLELPEAPQVCEPTSVMLRLYDRHGAPLYARRFAIDRGATLTCELHELLPQAKRGNVDSGQVVIDFEGNHVGSSRAYLHWYNDHSLTSSHEKFGLTIPAVGGFWTVPNVQDSDEYRVHLAVTNLDAQWYVSDVVLKDDEGHELQTEVGLPPNGSRFVALDELFQNPRGFLHGQPGVLYFGNNRQPAMYYYFVQNQRLGTWRAQHL